MSLLKKFACLFLGHKSSLYPGITPPLQLGWAHPAPESKQSPHTMRTEPSTATIQGPLYAIDLCKRCESLYVKQETPRCIYCARDKAEHVGGYCTFLCLNCSKPANTHIEDKCPFEASNFKGFVFTPALKIQ